MSPTPIKTPLERLLSALRKSHRLFDSPSNPAQNAKNKADGTPVTVMDRTINDAVRRVVLNAGDGWVSEEDEPIDMTFDGVRWIVDPIDGTAMYVRGVPEYAVSIAALAGDTGVAGILNPSTQTTTHVDEKFNVFRNGVPVQTSKRTTAVKSVLISRSEHESARWKKFESSDITIVPLGSIANKMAMVATGDSDGVASVAPKNIWDIAAGVLLIRAAGGTVVDLDGNSVDLRSNTKVNGILAGPDWVIDDLYRSVSKMLNS